MIAPGSLPIPTDEALPRFQQFLSRLPAGVNAYPECRERWRLSHHLLQQVDLRPYAGHLPSQLRVWLDGSLPPGGWIPQVHAHALRLAMRELSFPSDEVFTDFVYRAVREVLARRWCNQALPVSMRMASLQRRWRRCRTGVTMTVERMEGFPGLRLKSGFPADLVPDLEARCQAMVLRADLERLLDTSVSVSVDRVGSTEMVLVGTWQSNREP